VSVAAGAGLHRGVRVGTRVCVQVPATSANLGPGFDSLGLALGLHDVVTVEITAAGLEVQVEGYGEHDLQRGEEHLVVRAFRAGLERAGAAQPGLRLHCRNQIPHGRGLGSSAAAVVAGLFAATGCLLDPAALDPAALLELATRFEGHPDNAAAALLGGFTVSWDDARGDGARGVRLDLHPGVQPVLCVPDGELATTHARAILPARVAHADAAFNAARSALLVEALTRRPELLLPATEDRLHQEHRAAAMPHTWALLQRVRSQGVAAVVSGAGPAVLALVTQEGAAAVVEAAAAADSADAGRWQVLRPGMDTVGARFMTATG
jgi:homoserine kinase